MEEQTCYLRQPCTHPARNEDTYFPEMDKKHTETHTLFNSLSLGLVCCTSSIFSNVVPNSDAAGLRVRVRVRYETGMVTRGRVVSAAALL